MPLVAHFLGQGVLVLGLVIRYNLISRLHTGTEISRSQGSDSDALCDRMLRLIMMQVTEMNHLLNMLKLALQETARALRMSVMKNRKSASDRMCLTLGCLMLEVTFQSWSLFCRK